MSPLVDLAKKNVSRAKGRLTRAKNQGHPLRVLIDLNRDREKAKAFERRVFQYQHTLEDAGITTLDDAAAFLRSKGVEW